MQGLRPGANFCDPAFLSTSAKKDIAFDSNSIGRGCIVFVIGSKTGVDVSKESRHKDEAEILFRPSTLFKIKAVETGPEGIITVVKMEEHY